MAKRKLSKNQSRRIKKKQSIFFESDIKNHSVDDEHVINPLRSGRVTAHFGSQVEVDTDGEIIRCHIRANIENVVTGDQVVWQGEKGNGVVESVQPRQSELCRPDSFGNLKPVAANIDQILITIAPQPEPFANLIDRYIVASENLGISPTLLINKMDLIKDQDPKFEQLKSIYAQLGYPIIYVSAHTQGGLTPLLTQLEQHTSIFVGQSGVGKSSIIKSLLPNLDIRVGELSDAKEKGRHTTTNSRLYTLNNDAEIIDSPGIREFGLWHMTAEEVLYGFKEFRVLAQQCRFRDCTHQNEPGCAIKNALAKGEVTEQRYLSFIHIINSIDNVDIKKAPR